MAREHKGQAVPYYVKDYCVLDLETTGPYVNTAKIVEVGLLRVRNDKVVDTCDLLVNPGCPIPRSATAVNHISNSMVKDAPGLDQVIDGVLDFIGNDVVVGYNHAAYDMNLVYDACMELRGRPFTNDYIDVYHAAKRSLAGLPDYKLETVSRHYDLDTRNGHRALKDCSLTKCCYDALYREFGNASFKPRSGRRASRQIEKASGICVFDAILSDAEKGL